MRVSLSSLPSLVFKPCTPRLHCAVGPVTSASSQSSRKRKVLWNFTRLSSVVENIQRRNKTYASKLTFPRFRKDEVEPFVPFHRLSMERSLFPGDVSAPRRTEDKLCYQYLFCLFLFIKLLKEQHEKGSERCWFCGIVGHAPSAVIDASAACLLPTGSAASKKVPCWFFSEFWFCLADERLCNWWCEAELRATSTKIASPFVCTDSVFPGVHLCSLGVNSATGSTGVDVNSRSKGVFLLCSIPIPVYIKPE